MLIPTHDQLTHSANEDNPFESADLLTFSALTTDAQASTVLHGARPTSESEAVPAGVTSTSGHLSNQ